jgi:murein DD-endopeptidase MepM/ murein hydrolase activator NlpD
MLFNHPVLRRALLAVLIPGGAFLAPAPASAHSTAPQTTVAALDACPVAGQSDFVDSWGDARSSGRRHEGVDMAAERGTPVLAVRDGDAEFKRSRLGGNAIWLVTASGERFYYAHLDGWEGESRSVTAGEIIGYVGNTGNAKGDHLHFETRAGDEAVNPYPFTERACSAPLGGAQRAAAARLLLR